MKQLGATNKQVISYGTALRKVYNDWTNATEEAKYGKLLMAGMAPIDADRYSKWCSSLSIIPSPYFEEIFKQSNINHTAL